VPIAHYDALLAERDAARAELAAVDRQFLDRVTYKQQRDNYMARAEVLEAAIKTVLAGTCANWPDTLRAALDRVGKQP